MTTSELERTAMHRALALAGNGPRGGNPRVGAVILSPAGDVLAEGWHRGVGTAHAEVDALSKLAPGAARGATAVVTLEPCNHTGHTGPCALALIEAGIGRVVFAVSDPGASSGGGAERLREAGVDVESGLLESEAREVIEDWLFAYTHGRARVVIKWAQSLDGRAAAADGSSQWITGPEARADVHLRRAASDAIMVGTGTLLADDPALTARDGDTLFDTQPIPVIVGTRPVPQNAAVRSHPHSLLTFSGDDLPAHLAELWRRGIQRVFVEGGPTLVSALIRDGLADEFLCYLAPVLLGGQRLAFTDLGITSIDEALRLDTVEIIPLGSDILWIARRAPQGKKAS